LLSVNIKFRQLTRLSRYPYVGSRTTVGLATMEKTTNSDWKKEHPLDFDNATDRKPVRAAYFHTALGPIHSMHRSRLLAMPPIRVHGQSS
jgi:hypothetical protein